MVDLCRFSEAILRATHLAERMKAQVALTNLGPATMVALVMSLWPLVVIVVMIHDLDVLFAVGLVGKLWTTRVAAWLFWCVRHGQASFLRT